MNELLTHPSLTDFAELGLTWLSNYFLHSSLLLVAALLIEKSTFLKSLIKLETLWRIALFGGVISASVAVYVAHTPLNLGSSLLSQVSPASSTTTMPSIQIAHELQPKVQTSSASPNTNFSADETRPSLNLEHYTSVQENLEFQVPRSKMHHLNGAFLLWITWCILVLGTFALRIHTINRRVRQLNTLTVDALQFWSKDSQHLHLKLNKIKTGNEWNSPFVTPNGQIYLPTWALTELSQAQRESMLAHELAHLKRCDPYWRIASLLLTRIFFFQALNFYALRRLNICAELECDRIAASQTQQAQALAEAIYACAKRTKTHEFNQLALAIQHYSEPNFNRVKALLHPSAISPLRKTSTMEILSKTFAWTGAIALIAWSIPVMKINAETLPNLAQELKAFVAIPEKIQLNRQQESEPSSVATTTARPTEITPKGIEFIQSSSDLNNEKSARAQSQLEQIKNSTPSMTDTEITLTNPSANDARQLEQGIAAFKQNDFEIARALLGKLAEQNHPEAQVLFAEMLWNGWGGESNAALAERYFRQAAALGNERAKNYLPMLNNRLIHSQEITRLVNSIDAAPYREQFAHCKDSWGKILATILPSPTFVFTDVSYEQHYNKFETESNSFNECYKKFTSSIDRDLNQAELLKPIQASMTPIEIKQTLAKLKQTYQTLKEETDVFFVEARKDFSNKARQVQLQAWHQAFINKQEDRLNKLTRYSDQLINTQNSKR